MASCRLQGTPRRSVSPLGQLKWNPALDRVEVEINELQVYLGVQSASQPHPHLEDGTVYRPVRPTELDKIKNLSH